MTKDLIPTKGTMRQLARAASQEAPKYFTREEIPRVKFANILKSIVMDYIQDKRLNKDA